MQKILYFDCETTGTDPVKHDIIQLAGVIEIDGKIAEEFNFKIRPLNFESIDQRALDVNGITTDQLKEYPEAREVYGQIIALFSKHVNKYARADKFVVCGYNVQFDIEFLKNFFEKNGDPYLFSWLGVRKDPMPVLNYLKSIGQFEAENLKLATVCKVWGIEIDAHDAMSDIKATKAVIEKLDGILKA